MRRCHAIVSFTPPLCELQHSRSPDRQLIYTAIFVAVNLNKFDSDSPCARVYRQGRYSRVVDLWIYVADAAIGLRRASKNKEMWTEKHCCCVF